MKWPVFPGIFPGALLASSGSSAPTPEAMRAQVNQVFQFTQNSETTDWPDGYKTTATAYRWISEDYLRLPIGEPEHLLMVDRLVEGTPDRCLAGIWLKKNSRQWCGLAIPLDG